MKNNVFSVKIMINKYVTCNQNVNTKHVYFVYLNYQFKIKVLSAKTVLTDYLYLLLIIKILYLIYIIVYIFIIYISKNIYNFIYIYIYI